MESMASIALVCGNNFQPYALETFDNAMCIIETVSLYLVTSGEGLFAEEDADPIVCAADLLDGLVEGLGQNFATLVASSQRYGPQFLPMLHNLTQHEAPSVRMSAFAILGDLARKAPSLLQPALSELLKEAIECLDPIQPTVCNNAVWAIGEICVRCGANPEPLRPCAKNLVQSLAALLMGNGLGGSSGHGSTIPGLPENAASTMGRLAKVDSAFVSSELPRFLTGWCDGMAGIIDPKERKDAYEGFIRAVYANPGAIQAASANPAEAILSIVFAVVSWHMPPSENGGSNGAWRADMALQPFPQNEAELGRALAKLLQDIKASAGEEVWHRVQGHAPVNVRQLLREVYRV
jgi:transportin-1